MSATEPRASAGGEAATAMSALRPLDRRHRRYAAPSRLGSLALFMVLLSLAHAIDSNRPQAGTRAVTAPSAQKASRSNGLSAVLSHNSSSSPTAVDRQHLPSKPSKEYSPAAAVPHGKPKGINGKTTPVASATPGHVASQSAQDEHQVPRKLNDVPGAADADADALLSATHGDVNAAVHASTNGSQPGGRAPSCGGCDRRESALSKTMRLATYGRAFKAIGPIKSAIFGACVLVCICLAMRRMFSQEILLTLFYSFLYLVASPTAILVNKILMKDYGFGYPVLVSAIGQAATSLCSAVVVASGHETLENGRKVPTQNMLVLGGASALALVLGQYPYLYLTVAFIQMLKAFSPAYMVVFLSCMGVEYPSKRVIFCVLGLSICTAVASAGEVNFNLIGVLFMAGSLSLDVLACILSDSGIGNRAYAAHGLER